MIVVKLTSAVTARAPVYLNLDHIISFADQAGGCAIKITGGSSSSALVALTESAEMPSTSLRPYRARSSVFAHLSPSCVLLMTMAVATQRDAAL